MATLIAQQAASGPPPRILRPAARPPSVEHRRVALVWMPVLVPATEYGLYQGLTRALGPRLGYFLGFAVYWIGWCVLFPLWVVGWRGIRDMFGPARPRFGRPAWLGLTALGLPLVLGYAVAFPRALADATPGIVLASLGLASVNATGEEILWRGLYRRMFPGDTWLGLVWPTIGFGVWHFAPQSVRPNTRPGGAWSFVLVAGVFGLGWAWLAQRSGSIRWTTAAHILFDFAGLGASIYAGPRALPMH
jgi:membrane protease YdiL (CAAX protease family)